jgi:hypothetical protein
MTAPWIIEILKKYLDVQFYQHGVEYDPNSTMVCVDVLHQDKLYSNFKDRGFRVVIDNLWELKNYHHQTYPDAIDALVLHNVNWFWYNESLWYLHNQLNTYQPNRSYQHKAFMPMRLRRPHRTMLYNCMIPYLDDFVWSYVAEGRQLPRDQDLSDWQTQRYFNSSWYDSTCFSLVAETQVDSTVDQPVFITEKTFKPIAFKHPFMILGNNRTLAHLHSLGFETYENLFDESYDNQNLEEKLKTITANVQAFVKQPHDQLTLDKIQHNHNRFFDSELVKQRLVNEIILPIVEYAKT